MSSFSRNAQRSALRPIKLRVSARMIDRRHQLRELYGFNFPDDFFRFWKFVNRLQPLEPLTALLDLSIQLVGPFEILAGRFDREEGHPPAPCAGHGRGNIKGHSSRSANRRKYIP